MQKLDPLSKQSATEYSEAAGFSASETAANGALFSRYAFKAALATPLIVGSVAIALGGISTRARLLSIALIVTSLALLIIEKYAPGSIIRENRQAPSKELPLLGASPKITLKSFLPLIKKGENGESYLLESECVGILSYLKAHQDTLIAKAKLENKCVRVKAHDCPDLPRTILVTPEENIFVILNRTESKKDKTVGDGTLKKVKLCFELTQQKMCTHITFKDPNKPHLLDAIFKREQNEISLLSKWKGRPHFLQLLATDTYTSKKQTKKSSIITPYYSSGNLSSVLKTTEFSSDEKKAFFLKAALAVQEMHTSGYAHCDIKPENLLVDEEKNPVLIDFESSLEINEENKDKIAGTVIRFHPAVAALTKAVREKDEETKLTLHKRLPPLTSRDVWALGSLFLRMATPEKPLPWSPPPNINDLPTKIKIVENNLINLLSNSSEPVFPKPIDETSLEYLAWNMLQVDPKRQWDLNQVISFLKDHRS